MSSASVNRTSWRLFFALPLAALLAIPAMSRADDDALPAFAAFGKSRCRVEITGNKELSTSRLLSGIAAELTDFETSGCGKAKADDAAFALENLYRQEGFSTSTVTYQHFVDGDRPGATFLVEEGGRVLVGAVSFSGNAAFPQDRLLPIAAETIQPGAPFVANAARTAAASIRDFYYSEGFLEVEVAEPQLAHAADRATVDIAFQITEKTRRLIEGVDYSGDLMDELAAEMKEAATEFTGQPYFPRRRLTLRHRVQELYSNRGFPRAEINVREKGGEDGHIRMAVAVKKGELVKIGKIAISGNDRTGLDFIKSRLHFSEGDTYSQNARRESLRDLYRSGLFNRVSITLRDDSALIIEVEEKPAIEVFVEPGWGSYEMLRLGFGMRHRNLWGTGRILDTSGRVSMKGENVEVGITDPWFLRSGLSASLPVSFRRRVEPSFDRKELGASFFLSKKFSDSLTATTGYTQRRTDISDIDAAAAAAEPESGYNIGAVSSRLTYDTKNDIFFPTDGIRLSTGVELADEYLASTINYLRLTGSARSYHYIGAGFIAGLRYETGLMLPGRERTPLPLSERFYNGGDNSVRAFEESKLGPMAGGSGSEPLGGLAYNVVSVELRRRFAGNLAGSIFADLGNVAPNLAPGNDDDPSDGDRAEVIGRTLDQYFRDLRPGFGCGLQYLLPVGPARLDVAFNPYRREEHDEPGMVVHLTVGMAF